MSLEGKAEPEPNCGTCFIRRTMQQMSLKGAGRSELSDRTFLPLHQTIAVSQYVPALQAADPTEQRHCSIFATAMPVSLTIAETSGDCKQHTLVCLWKQSGL